MKAFLLAAGLGNRLRPITDRIPKCMVPICGKPLLELWLDLLGRHDVEEVLVNTHYLPRKVQEFSKRWDRKPVLRLSHEKELYGSAGTLRRNWDFVAGEESFLVCYADNLTDIDLGKLIDAHHRHRGLVTMALFRADRPTECGIVELSESGVVLSFEEKPSAPKSCLANAGIYVMRQTIHPHLPLKTPSDIGFDLLPECVGEAYGWIWEGLLIDVGSPASYDRAKQVWSRRDRIA